MKKLLVVLLVMLCAVCAPQGSEKPTTSNDRLAHYDCYKTAGKIEIDGKLDEESWQRAKSTGLFVLCSGKKAPVRTTAKMLWDASAFYIAFECVDEDIYATFKDRDAELYSQDVVEVFVMEQGLKVGNFIEYEVSPLGTLFDVYNVRPYAGIKEWTSPGFRAAGSLRGTVNDAKDKDGGYTVEIVIPFEDLYLRKKRDEMTPKDGSTIRLNLYRIEYNTPKEKLGGPGADAVLLAWSPPGKLGFHVPSAFGVVTFVDKPVGAK